MNGRPHVPGQPALPANRPTGLARKAARANRKADRHAYKVKRAVEQVTTPDQTYWRGLQTHARRVKAVVAKVADDGPHSFQAPLAGMTLKVVEVRVPDPEGGGTVYLYDEDGAGWDFVTRRQGKGIVPVAIIIERVIEE